MLLRDVMTRDVETVRPENTLQEAAQKMRELDVGPLPVVRDRRLVGMVTDRDIAVRSVAEGDNPMLAKVEKVMTPEVVTCYEDQDVSEAAKTMRENQIRRLVVVDRDQNLVGIVSLGDLAVDAEDDAMAGSTLEAVSWPSAPNRSS